MHRYPPPTLDEFWDKISEDFILAAIGDVEQGYNETLKTLRSFLQGHRKCLGEYGLPQPVADNNEVECELRRWLLQAAALQEQVRIGLLLFNSEQRAIFQQVQSLGVNPYLPTGYMVST